MTIRGALYYYIGLTAIIQYGVSAAAPGPAACANLTSTLGSSIVDNNAWSPSYIESTTEYWNTLQNLYKPSCVVYPSSAQDVSITLQAVRAAGSRFAVKTVGHNPNNFFSSVNAGVLIDLGNMTGLSYDLDTTLATFEPGSSFGDIYNYYAQYNRTVVGARLGEVGTGLALGGGLSYLSPQYGLACDSFRELEIVLPSGEIVIASNTEYTDLFFASRGGGGNAYGVVTKYTVQSRPIGEFYAGNIIYLFEQEDAVASAIENFIQYNEDPKASIIGTYEILGTPSLELDLDQAVLMFLVYDGPDPGNAFVNFTSIPYLINTMGLKTYPEVTNDMPLPMITELGRGHNIFRVGVHRVGDGSYKAVYNAWRAWAEDNKGSYVLLSLDFQPIPLSLTEASKSQGGNAMQMPDGPWYWVNYLISSSPLLSTSEYNAVQASFRDMVASVGNAEGLPLFINDANKDQNPLKTFSTYSKLQEIKEKYDPHHFFLNFTGGWSFD